MEALVFFSKKISRHKLLRVVILLFFSGHLPAPALAQLYGGVLGGVSTLSGDARSLLNPGSTAFSSYDPRNGGAVEVLMGKHFSDYFSAQASYIWNSNELTLTAASFNKEYKSDIRNDEAVPSRV